MQTGLWKVPGTSSCVLSWVQFASTGGKDNMICESIQHLPAAHALIELLFVSKKKKAELNEDKKELSGFDINTRH